MRFRDLNELNELNEMAQYIIVLKWQNKLINALNFARNSEQIENDSKILKI